MGDALLWEENSVKLLGPFIDSDFSFHGDVKIICKKASQKLSAIARLVNDVSEHRKKVLIKTLFDSQFS